MDVDDFAPRLSFFFNSHNDFLEEIAKYRAARRIWYRVMKDRFGARNPRSWALRFHTQTAGVSLTAQQPLNNIVRVAIQALAGVLGGTQSLHTDAYDEALALPSDEAALIALRTQQIIAHESGVTNTVDPLGGSYFIEKLTRDMEEGALEYFRKIDDFGGMVEAIDAGFPQREIQESSYQYQLAVDSRDKIIVGVNEYVMKDQPMGVPLLQIDESTAELQAERLKKLRSERNNARVQTTLKSLVDGARAGHNTMPLLLDCVREYATLGEMCDALRPVFGEYQEPMF
jgi:methylmalonyl-CoA mutase N-terminal domain/subunit